MALIDLANPTRFLSLSGRILPWLAAATALCFAFGFWLAAGAPDERYVIPTAHAEQAHSLEEIATDCAVSAYDHAGEEQPFGVGSGPQVRIAVEDLRVRTARLQDEG